MDEQEYINILQHKDEEIAALKNRIKELENPEQGIYDLWIPKDGENYWYINSKGEPKKDIWDSLPENYARLNRGNIFKTEDDASYESERIKIIATIKQLSRDFHMGSSNFYLYIFGPENHLSYDYIADNNIQGVIYFESEEKIQEAIKTVGVDNIKKYLFDYNRLY